MAKKQVRKNRYKNPGKKNPAPKQRPRFIRIGVILAAVGGIGMLTVMSLALIFAHDCLTQCDYFRAENISVAGMVRLTEEEILDFAGINRGENILAINLALARKQLLAHPWVADAEISRELPKGIAVRVKEHTPLAILSMGRKFLINTKGEIFKEHDPSDPKHLPMVRGLDYSDLGLIREGQTPLAAVVDWLRYRSSMKQFIPGIQVKEIQIDREIGLTLLLADGDRSICLGYRNYRHKTDRLRRIVNYLRRRSQLKDIQSINLMNPDRVILRPVG